MLKQTLKRMALTGATVMVLLSTVAPAAMAAPAAYQDQAVYQDQQAELFCPGCWIAWICQVRPDLCTPPPKDPPKLYPE